MRDNIDHAKSELRILHRVLEQLKAESSPMEMCRLLLFIESESNKTEIAHEFIKHLRLIVSCGLTK